MNVPSRAPVLIGGLGGSGTRVVARILAQAGFFIGASRNRAEDSVPMAEYYVSWLRHYIVHGGSFPDSIGLSAAEGFWRAIARHRNGIERPDDPWAVKNPRGLLMLPYWHAAFPKLRMIHVLRNGLDMAYSTNRDQLDMFQDNFLAPADRKLPLPLRAMVYWRMANEQAAVYGGSFLGERYLFLRFEDLCRNPRSIIEQIAGFVAKPIDSEATVTMVNPPVSIGRWRSGSAEEIRSLVELGRTALDRFGYDYPGRREEDTTK